jgi:hypothetical protein
LAPRKSIPSISIERAAGAGGWAKYGHIPALQYLEDFEIIAVSSRKKETAAEYAAKFNILHAFDDEQALITHPHVDLVVILAPAPEHARLAKAAIAAGKDVYSEWPLTTKTSDSEELLALAEAKGVRQIVVHNRKIVEMMLAHNFPCLIQRLIFEAIIRFFYHDSSDKRRLGIMAKAGSLPLRVLAFHGPNKMIT